MSEISQNVTVPPGYTPERVGFFTDAVFAIAMTLLVIEIPRPEGNEFEVGDGTRAEAAARLWHYFADQKSAFTSYLLAFYVLWIVWRQHHVLFDRLSRLDASAVRWHFSLLLLVGFLPYGTTVAGHYFVNPLAAALFGLSVGGVLLSRTAIQTVAYRNDLFRPEVDREKIRMELVASWGVVAYWLSCTGAAWLSAWAQLGWFLTAPAGNLFSLLSHRRLGR